MPTGGERGRGRCSAKREARRVESGVPGHLLVVPGFGRDPHLDTVHHVRPLRRLRQRRALGAHQPLAGRLHAGPGDRHRPGGPAQAPRPVALLGLGDGDDPLERAVPRQHPVCGPPAAVCGLHPCGVRHRLGRRHVDASLPPPGSSSGVHLRVPLARPGQSRWVRAGCTLAAHRLHGEHLHAHALVRHAASRHDQRTGRGPLCGGPRAGRHRLRW